MPATSPRPTAALVLADARFGAAAWVFTAPQPRSASCSHRHDGYRTLTDPSYPADHHLTFPYRNVGTNAEDIEATTIARAWCEAGRYRALQLASTSIWTWFRARGIAGSGVDTGR